MLLVLAILFAGCAIFVKNFFAPINMQGLLLAVSTVGIVSCTMLFCLASGNFDLSVGSVLACAGVIASVVMNKSGSVTLGICAGEPEAGDPAIRNGPDSRRRRPGFAP